MAYDVRTYIGRQKLAKAHAEGLAVPKITQVGWGTGGADVDGNILQPSVIQTSVSGELIKTNVTYSYDNDYKSVIFHCTLSAVVGGGVVGNSISSMGLYDSAGDLIAIKNFKPKSIVEDTIISLDWIENF